MTDGEVENILPLNLSDFEKREWLALRYAREWALAGGKEPFWEHAQAYRDAYTEEERGRILKLMRLTQFFNFTMNFINRKPWRDETSRKVG